MAKFTYTKRDDGRLVKKVTINKKPIYLYSYDEKDLERQYIKLKNDANNNKKIVQKCSFTISQYADYWHEHYISNETLSSKTKKDYKDCIRLYIKPNIGKLKLSDVQEVDINDLLQKLSLQGITRRKEMTLQILNSMFKKALKNKLIEDNPASDVKLIKHVAEEKQPLPLNIIDLILNMPNDLDDSVFMIKFMLTTGLRLEEVSPLCKKDIVKLTKMLKVNKVVDLDNKDLPITNYTKNKDRREVPILDFIYNDLIQKITIQKDNLIFPNTKGNLKSRTSFRRDLERFLKLFNEYYEKKQKEIDKTFILNDENQIKFTYHQLRHSYACILHKADIDLKTAQSFTGHKDLKVLLEIYTHLDDADIQKAKNKLNTFFNKKKVVKKVVKFKGSFSLNA